MSIVNLIADVANQQKVLVLNDNDGRKLLIGPCNPCKLISLIVCTAFEREGMEIGGIVAATMVDADLITLNLIGIEITPTRIMSFDEIRQQMETAYVTARV